jgi:hypothetical protein
VAKHCTFERADLGSWIVGETRPPKRSRVEHDQRSTITREGRTDMDKDKDREQEKEYDVETDSDEVDPSQESISASESMSHPPTSTRYRLTTNSRQLHT